MNSFWWWAGSRRGKILWVRFRRLKNCLNDTIWFWSGGGPLGGKRFGTICETVGKGAGGEGYGSEAVWDYLRDSRLGERVKGVGHIRREELERLYQAASLLLFPSFDEGFGLPVLEAMAYGLPVVTSHASALPEVGGEAALYVDPHDTHDIAEKVAWVVENPQLRARMVEAGLTRVQTFSWRRAAERTLEVYKEVLEK